MKDFLRHLFLPRESNNHRAKLLHHSTISYVIVALFTLTFFFSFVEKNFASVLGISANISAEELLVLVNKERQDRGLSALQLDNQLSSAANLKAQDMFANNYWAHTSPGGMSPWVFIKSAGYEYLYAGENLARGFTSSPDVVKAWMESPSHRDNMLSSNYDEIGFAILTGTLTGEETVLVVEMFGRRFDGVAIAPTAKPTNFQITPTPSISGVTPTLVPLVPRSIQAEQQVVASIKNQPLINSGSLPKQVSILLIAVFLFIFITDIIIIERKKIVRLFSHTHTVDHVIFLAIILATIIMISRGAVL
ncbi:MAG: hypothetical protein HYT11_01455 [Candidatus Levybacteria bacterium]|nr:hypothetical protein [Candidatus Levybacteria bacterium]